MKASRYTYLTMMGHLCTDINQGALPAILPFLVTSKGISYAAAAGLVFAANCVSTVVQPLFGYLGDKFSRPWFMALGVFLAGVGLSVVGYLESYWAIFFAVSVSGIGIAIFHPEGGRVSNLVSGEKKGTGMSVFAVGGNIGFAIGPVITTAALNAWGLKGTAALLVPVTLMAIAVLSCSGRIQKITSRDTEAEKKQTQIVGTDDWGGFWKVNSVMLCRSIISYGLTTFVPLYWIGVLMQTKASGNAKLTLFSLAAAAATLIGGRMADRFGFNRVVRFGYTLLVPLMLFFALTKNVLFATALLVFIAFSLNGPHSTMVTLGQGFLPNHVGLASGISLGLTVSAGGMTAPGIGWIGDRFGLSYSMYAMIAISVVAMVCAYIVPKPKAEKEIESLPEAAGSIR